MSKDLEIEFYLSEIFGDWDASGEDCAASLQKSTGAIDRFFEGSPLQTPVERLNDADSSELKDLNSFLKVEKQRIRGMTSREIRAQSRMFCVKQLMPSRRFDLAARVQGGYSFPRFSYPGKVETPSPLQNERGRQMAITTVANRTDADVLTSELEVLRNRLNNELEHASRMRETYEAQCRRSDLDDDPRPLRIKQQLEIAEARVMAMKADIAEKHRLLDEAQGREAEESRERALKEQFEGASERLAGSQEEIARLRVGYAALPEKIRLAERHFQDALRAFNDLRQAHISRDGGAPDLTARVRSESIR